MSNYALLSPQILPLIQLWKSTPDTELEIRLCGPNGGVDEAIYRRFKAAVNESMEDPEIGPRWTNKSELRMISAFSRVSNSVSLRTRFFHDDRPPESHEVSTLAKTSLRAMGRSHHINLSVKSEKPRPFDRLNHEYYSFRTHERSVVTLDDERELSMEVTREGANKLLAANATPMCQIEFEFRPSLKSLSDVSIVTEIIARASELLGEYSEGGVPWPVEFYGLVE